MTSLLDLPHVSDCTVESCGYNHDGCHAGAVTVAGHAGAAECATFIPLSTKGGLDKVVAQVGACQRGECVHNESLECRADSVRIGAGAAKEDLADCLTYTPR
jgi:phage-related tail fiber protein